jgi:hypothetical protein
MYSSNESDGGAAWRGEFAGVATLPRPSVGVAGAQAWKRSASASSAGRRFAFTNLLVFKWRVPPGLFYVRQGSKSLTPAALARFRADFASSA